MVNSIKGWNTSNCTAFPFRPILPRLEHATHPTALLLFNPTRRHPSPTAPHVKLFKSSVTRNHPPPNCKAPPSSPREKQNQAHPTATTSSRIQLHFPVSYPHPTAKTHCIPQTLSYRIQLHCLSIPPQNSNSVIDSNAVLLFCAVWMSVFEVRCWFVARGQEQGS